MQTQLVVSPRRFSNRMNEKKYDIFESKLKMHHIIKKCAISNTNTCIILIDELCMEIIKMFHYIKHDSSEFDTSYDTSNDRLFDSIYIMTNNIPRQINKLLEINEMNKKTIKIAKQNIVFLQYIQQCIRMHWKERFDSLPKNRLNDDVLSVIASYNTMIPKII